MHTMFCMCTQLFGHIACTYEHKERDYMIVFCFVCSSVSCRYGFWRFLNVKCINFLFYNFSEILLLESWDHVGWFRFLFPHSLEINDVTLLNFFVTFVCGKVKYGVLYRPLWLHALPFSLAPLSFGIALCFSPHQAPTCLSSVCRLGSFLSWMQSNSRLHRNRSRIAPPHMCLCTYGCVYGHLYVSLHT